MSVSVRRPIILAASSRARVFRERGLFFLLLFGTVLLQSALPAALGAGWFRPDLLLVLVVFWNATRSPGEGWSAALLGGLIGDVFSAGRLGMGAVSLAAGARAAVLLCRSLQSERLGTKVLMVAIASLVSSGAHYLLLIVFQSQPSASWALREAIWPHLWQTVVIAPLWWRMGEKALPK